MQYIIIIRLIQLIAFQLMYLIAISSLPTNIYLILIIIITFIFIQFVIHCLLYNVSTKNAETIDMETIVENALQNLCKK